MKLGVVTERGEGPLMPRKELWEGRCLPFTLEFVNGLLLLHSFVLFYILSCLWLT